MTIRNRIPVRNVRDLRLRRYGVGVCEVDLERQGDERVGEREQEVGAECGEPAPEDELPELQGRVALWVDVGHVYGEVEGEAEEGDDD